MPAPPLPASADVAPLAELLMTALHTHTPPPPASSSQHPINLLTPTFHRENVHLTSLIGYNFLKLAAAMFKKTSSVYLEFKGIESWQEYVAEDWQLVAPSFAVAQSQTSHTELITHATCCLSVPAFHLSPPISIYGYLYMV